MDITFEGVARHILGSRPAALETDWSVASHRTLDAVETWHMPGFCVDLVNAKTVHVYRGGERRTISR